VDAAKAETRDNSDKQMIDGWIMKLDGGFRSLNRIVELTILNSCYQEGGEPRGSLWGYGADVPSGVAEADSTALARKYALVGSWNGWSQFIDFTGPKPEGSGHVFCAQVVVPAGKDVEFQVVCDNDWELRLFPAGIPPDQGDATGSTVLGPNASCFAHGRNWRLVGFSQKALLEVKMDPTGERYVKWSLVMDSSE